MRRIIVALNEPERNGDFITWANLEIVALSGLSVKKSSGHGKPHFEVNQGPVSGSVHIVARAERTRASYEWQYRLDGTTWTSAEDTVQADQWLYGLTRGVRCFFRYRARTKAGLGDWSEVVSSLVL